MMVPFRHPFKFFPQGLTLVVAFTFTLGMPWAQEDEQLDPVESLVEAMNVRHIGPGTMSGRVTSIAVPTTNRKSSTSERRQAGFGKAPVPASRGTPSSTTNPPKASALSR